MTWSLDVSAWFWSGYQQCPIMTPWTKLVQFFSFVYVFSFIHANVYNLHHLYCLFVPHLCYSRYDTLPSSPCTSVLSHRNVFFIWYSAAGDGAAVSPVLQEQGRSLCSPALCLCGQSTLSACESLVIWYWKTLSWVCCLWVIYRQQFGKSCW